MQRSRVLKATTEQLAKLEAECREKINATFKDIFLLSNGIIVKKHKVCHGCFKLKHAHDGFQSMRNECKSCRAEYNLARRRANGQDF